MSLDHGAAAAFSELTTTTTVYGFRESQRTEGEHLDETSRREFSYVLKEGTTNRARRCCSPRTLTTIDSTRADEKEALQRESIDRDCRFS